MEIWVWLERMEREPGFFGGVQQERWGKCGNECLGWGCGGVGRVSVRTPRAVLAVWIRALNFVLFSSYDVVGSKETISTTCHFNKPVITFIPQMTVSCVLAEDGSSSEARSGPTGALPPSGSTAMEPSGQFVSAVWWGGNFWTESLTLKTAVVFCEVCFTIAGTWKACDFTQP